MRIAIVSDTHFGDPMGTLVERKDDHKPSKGRRYDAFKAAAGKGNDYLVLLGDILDFSVASYQEAYEAAKTFFLLIQKDGIAKQMIYIPGNHDADLWHTVEYEVNVIDQIKKGCSPRPFRLSVPGVIDDRKKGPHRGFTLPGVHERSEPDAPKYAGLFLDQITVAQTKAEPLETEGEPISFNFAYPNLYLITDTESVLITHGHYLETYWALASEWAVKIAREDLRIGGALAVKEMVGINFPLSQLACSGVGQAGPLTRVVRQVQRDVKDGDLARIKLYLDRLDQEVDTITRFPWYRSYLEWLTDAASDAIKRLALASLQEARETRYNEGFIHRKQVQDRFLNFYVASLIEIDTLNRTYGYNIPAPSYVIFGHTHRPTPWGDPAAPKTRPAPETAMRPIVLYNTGGWLMRQDEQGKPEFCGAEVFRYESGKGWRSIAIR